MKINPQPATLVSPGSLSPKAEPVDAAPNPPTRGLPLAVLPGVTISVLVSLLLGALTTFQLQRDGRRELSARESLLAESLVPLTEQVEEAKKIGEIAHRLSSQRLAEISSSRADYNVVLRAADGSIVASATSGGSVLPPKNSLLATMRVQPKALSTGTGTLIVWQDASELSSKMTLRRREAMFDIAMTVLAVILVVHLAIYLLVSRPLNRLLAAIERFEQGNPAGFRKGSVARKLSWLD